jgi:hypothetical protein
MTPRGPAGAAIHVIALTRSPDRGRAEPASPTFKSVERPAMIRKLKSGGYRLYSRKKDPKTGKRRNLGTFKTREAAQKHERDVQFFKRH